ncbi:tyrosine-type recombinase/integrase [Brevibacillus sp. NRS-1366]|uniref:tyrosine-type recombinase/integrase n=1 Tax=Brevibacillus sp. NRS-1366 TaxID=3233899 RepID=UPI003D258A95
MKVLNENMYRERADRLAKITEDQWKQINKFNKEKVEEYLLESTHLSKQSQTQYKSALRQFYYWVHETYGEKKRIHELKKKDFMRFQNMLLRRGMSSNAIKLKRSCVSALNKYLINFYEDEDEFSTFRNFVDGVPNPTPNKVYKKIPLSHEEFELILQVLEEDEQWQIIAALHLLYASACRRSELIQLHKEIVGYPYVKDKDGKDTSYYKTHEVRAKGRGIDGKPRSLLFDDKARNAVLKWLEFRGDDNCPYIFVSKQNGEVKQINVTTVNYWCKEVMSDIIGRRVNPHLIRGTRSTHILEEGINIKQAQKLLGHEDPSTTDKFYDLRENKDEFNDIF